MYSHSFGNRLADLRNEYNITQKQLSEELKINRVAIARYEAGAQAPSLDNLISIAKYFDVSTDYLLGFSDIRSDKVHSDLKATCEFTDLSEKAIFNILEITQHNAVRTDGTSIPFNAFLNKFLESTEFVVLFQMLFTLATQSYYYRISPEKREFCPDSIKYQLLKLFDDILSSFDCTKNKDVYRLMKMYKEAPDNGNNNSEDK